MEGREIGKSESEKKTKRSDWNNILYMYNIYILYVWKLFDFAIKKTKFIYCDIIEVVWYVYTRRIGKLPYMEFRKRKFSIYGNNFAIDIKNKFYNLLTSTVRHILLINLNFLYIDPKKKILKRYRNTNLVFFKM